MQIIMASLYHITICSAFSLLYVIARKLVSFRGMYRILYTFDLIIMAVYVTPVYLLPSLLPVRVAVEQKNSGEAVQTANISVAYNDITFKNIEIEHHTNALFMVWACVAMILLIILAYSYIKTRQMMHYIFISGNKEINNGVMCVYHNKVECPSLIGIFNRILILPQEIDIEDKQLIMQHEMVHHKRMDVFRIVFCRIICIIYWFNPLLWIMLWLIKDDCEKSCDEMVIDKLSIEKQRKYMNLLIDYSYVNKPKYLMSTGIIDNKKILKERIMNIMEKKSGKKRFFVILCCSLLVVTMVIGGTVYAFTENEKDAICEAIKDSFDDEYYSPWDSPYYINANADLMIPVESDKKRVVDYELVSIVGEYKDSYLYSVPKLKDGIEYTKKAVYEVEYKETYSDAYKSATGVSEETFNVLFILVKTDDGWKIAETGW